MPGSIDVSGGHTPLLQSHPDDADATSASGTSALAGRTRQAPSAPMHRAPGNSFMHFMRSVFRKIASVFPGASRVHEETTPLLSDTGRMQSTAVVPLHSVPDAALADLASQMKQTVKTLQQTHELGLFQRYSKADLDTLAFEARVRGELISRANKRIETDVDHLLADVAKRARYEPPAQLAKKTHNAFINADATLLSLRKHGFAELGTDAHAATTGFVAAGIGRLSAEDRRNVMRTLSVNDLTSIADLDSNSATLGTAAAILLARDEVRSRRERLTGTFAQTANDFLAQGSVSAQIMNPGQRLASDVHELAQSLFGLKAFCDSRGEPLPADADAMRNDIADRLYATLQASKIDLGKLSSDEINNLRADLGAFGIQLDRAQLETIAAQRLPELERACAQAVTQVLQGVQTGSPETVLRGLQKMEQSFETLRDTRNALLQDVKSAQDMFNLRQKVFVTAFESLAPAQRDAVHARLSGNGVIDIREALYLLGEKASDAHQSELGSLLNRMGAYLEELTTANTSLTPTPDVMARERTLSHDIQRAFTTLFGIQWDAEGTATFNV